MLLLHFTNFDEYLQSFLGISFLYRVVFFNLKLCALLFHLIKCFDIKVFAKFSLKKLRSLRVATLQYVLAPNAQVLHACMQLTTWTDSARFKENVMNCLLPRDLRSNKIALLHGSVFAYQKNLEKLWVTKINVEHSLYNFFSNLLSLHKLRSCASFPSNYSFCLFAQINFWGFQNR